MGIGSTTSTTCYQEFCVTRLIRINELPLPIWLISSGHWCQCGLVGPRRKIVLPSATDKSPKIKLKKKEKIRSGLHPIFVRLGVFDLFWENKGGKCSQIFKNFTWGQRNSFLVSFFFFFFGLFVCIRSGTHPLCVCCVLFWKMCHSETYLDW